jgi:putative ABC transport system permease protein
MFKNYLKTAFRNLWKNKTYSLLNIMGLSVGITCAALIFLWVEDEMNYNQQHLKKKDLYEVLENQTYDAKTYTFSSTPGLLAQAMKEEIPGIRNTTRLSWGESRLFNLGDKAIYERGQYADPSFFDIFTLPFVKGQARTAFSQLNNLIVSEKMANKFFGTVDVIGKTIKINNQEEGMISGVFQDIPENSTLKFEWLAPYEVYLKKNDWLNKWGNNGTMTFAELEASADLQTVNKKLNGFIKSKDTSAIAKPFLLPMNDWRLRNNFEEGKQTGGRIIYVNLFTIIAWIILLIACINFMNLATARSEQRAREVGVRKVLGAGKKMLVAQFIGEALLMSFLAVILAIGIIYLVLPGYNTLVEKHLSLGINKPSHSAALLLITIICGLVAGSYPSLYLSSFNPTSVLKGLKIKGSSAAVIRKGLVVAQFAISVILIICTIIIYQQIQHVKSRDLGYDKNNLIETAVRGDLIKHYDAVKQDLIKTGAVDNAALANLDMLEMGSSSEDFSWQGKDPNQKVLVTMDFISPEYMATTGMKVAKGREFRIANQDTLNVIINETLAGLIGRENPVGENILRDSVSYRIIGVVRDFIYGDMYAKSDPAIFFCKPDYANYLYIRLKQNSDPEQAVSKIGSVMKASVPGYPFDYHFVDDRFNQLFKSEMLIGKLSRIFAILAIFISCLGLFGLSAYTAERRTKEIGIRKVLGASVQGLAALLSTDFMKLILMSLVIAFPLAYWAMHKWLQNYAYRIAIDWTVFIFAGVAALLIALLTISFQAIRAAVSNPVRSLRSE